MGSDDVKVVKVQPYPFPIDLHIGGQVAKGSVLKLVQKGAIVRTELAVLKVGDEFQVNFELPVHKTQINLLAKVVKTYDRALVKVDPAHPDQKVERLAELLFKNIDNAQIRSIYNFLVAIRQVKP